MITSTNRVDKRQMLSNGLNKQNCSTSVNKILVTNCHMCLEQKQRTLLLLIEILFE